MASWVVTDKQTGKKLKLTSQDNTPPSPQEIEKVFSSQPTQKTNINPLQMGIEQATNVAGRLISPGGRNWVPGMEEEGFKKTLEMGRQFEESITNKVPDTKIPQVGMVNQALGQLGFEPTMRDAAGLAIGGATDPRMLAAGIGGMTEKPLIGFASKTLPAMLEKSAARKLGKAEGMFKRVADIPKGVLSEATEKGRKVPGVEYGTKAVKRSNSVEELFKKIVGQKEQAGAEKAAAIREIPNKEAPRTYLGKAREYVSKLRREGVHDPQEISKLEGLIDQEIDFLNRTPESVKDPVYFDERKQIFQREAAPLYKKIQAGTATGLEKETHYLYDALAKGYKQFLEEVGGEAVVSANKKSQGLIQATDFMRGPMEREVTKSKRGFFLDLIDSIRGGPHATGAAAFRNFVGSEVPFKKTSGKIERLVKQSDRRSGMAKSLREGFAEKRDIPDEVNLEFDIPEQDLQIPGGGRKLLGGPTAQGPSIRTPYDAPSGPTIEMGEYSAPTLQELAEKYGVPEYGGHKRSTQQPIGKIKSRNPELDAKVKRSLAEFAKRRRNK